MRKLNLIAGVLALLLFFWWLMPGAPVEVEIQPGLSAAQTAALLKENGVIESARMFRWAAKITRVDRKLKPGIYHLRRSMPLLWALRELESASGGVKIVIPEGFSAEQIAQRLEASGICRSREFMAYARRHKLEGYLFPATYFFDPDTPPEKVAARMLEEFNRRVPPAYQAANPKPSLTLGQALILASIVEREAELDSERPMIAAVYLNRLDKRMRLQADPTVQYALGYWKRGLTDKDLQADSPYNTYIHYGLPPGPICSPGLESFRAVLHPAQTDALYFVANNKGGHVFSETAAEQLKAKRAYKEGLKLLKARPAAPGDSSDGRGR